MYKASRQDAQKWKHPSQTSGCRLHQKPEAGGDRKIYNLFGRVYNRHVEK